jgi:hypothetical protein
LAGLPLHRESLCPGLLGRLLPPGSLEGVVDPAHEPADGRGRILVPRVDDIGRAEPARQVELFLGEVDRDDAGGAGQACSLDSVEADPAASEDRDARPRPDPAVLRTSKWRTPWSCSIRPTSIAFAGV